MRSFTPQNFGHVLIDDALTVWAALSAFDDFDRKGVRLRIFPK